VYVTDCYLRFAVLSVLLLNGAIKRGTANCYQKASSDRLRLLLLKAGFDEELILGLNRDELMAKYAEFLSSGDSDHEGAARVDPDHEQARYEHEQMMKRMELESYERIERKIGVRT